MRPRNGMVGLRYNLRHGRPTRGACGCTCAHRAWPRGVAIQNIVSWLRDDRCVSIRHGRVAIQRRGTTAARCNTAYHATRRACDTEQHGSWQVACCDTNLYRDRGELRHGIVRAATRLRHDRAQTTTRSGQVYYTAGLGLRYGTVRAQWARSQGPLSVHPMHSTQF